MLSLGLEQNYRVSECQHHFPQVKSDYTRSLWGDWGLDPAHWGEVRGWIPSPRLACWERDLELKHSAPSADSGARAPLRPGCVFGCRFACVNSPPRDHSGVSGGFTRRVGAKLEAESPHQVWRAGRETLTSSTQSQVPTLGLAPTSGQDVFLGGVLHPKTALRKITPGCLGASLGAFGRS